MGLNPPVPQQDSNWEIRAAVLLSLFFQVLLIFLGSTRKRSSAPLYRLTVWSCYLLADWVADLALGLLLNNMGNIGGGAGATTNNSSSPVIFAFWTPFLLLHLGGPDTITAYSVEDNELWNRHLIGLLFELFSASTIIFCSLRGNPLVPATMLMLVAGVIKYGERTYSLYSGSTESLRESILGPPEPNYSRARLMTEFRAKKRAGLPVELAIYDTQEADRLELFLRMPRRKSLEARAYEWFLTFRRLLVDVIISSKDRRLSQAFFLERDDMTPTEAYFLRDTEEIRSSSYPDPDDEPTIIRKLFEVMEVELNFMYDMVYTKAPVAHSIAGWVLRCICSGCLVSALAVFFFLDKPGHQIQPVDVGITYALLLGGLALDAAALLMLFFSTRAKVYLEELSRWLRFRWLAWLRQQVTKRWQTRRRWSGTVSQMNLIRYCLEKPGPYSSNKGGKWWLMIVKMLGIEEIVDDFFFIRRVRLKKDGEEERYGRLRRFFRERLLVPKCCRDKDSVEESLLFGFIFRGLKNAVQKLKKEQERKAQKLKMEQERKAQKLKKEQEERTEAAAAAAGTGTTPEQEASTEEDIEADKDAMAEKDAIAEVCRRRGDGVVKSHKDDINNKATTDADARFKVILDSVVNRDLDESLLLWHIATDLCRCQYRVRADDISGHAVGDAGDAGETALVKPMGPPTQKTTELQPIAETLSEYMMYLLSKQPDMLSATAGVGLRPYRDTCAEARQFFASKEAWLGINNKEVGMRRFLLNMDTSETPVSVKGDESKSVLLDAVNLAKELRKLDEELMWDLVAGVWGEMLSFAAVSGRGRTHVRSLNRGGELITFVWLLMQHVGLSNMYEIKKEDRVQLIVHY